MALLGTVTSGDALADVRRGEADELAGAETDDVTVTNILVNSPAGSSAAEGEGRGRLKT